MLARFERPECPANDIAQRCLIPVLHCKQVVGLAERMEASQESLPPNCLAQRLSGNGLHCGQRILDAMYGLIHQQFLGLVRPNTFHTEAKLASNGDREIDLAFAERMAF